MTATTVAYDLALAVVVGVIFSALAYAWKQAHHLWVEEGVQDGHKVYMLRGPLFFGSIQSFKDLFDPKNDPADDVIIDFQRSRVWDHSALEAIDALATKYEQAGKKLHLVHLSEDCKLLLNKAKDMVEVNSIEDPKYRVFADYTRADEIAAKQS